MCKCSVCNSTYNLNEFENCNIRDIMLSKDMCFNCAFWQEKVDLANEKGGDDNISSILIHLYPKEKIKNGTSESLVNPIVKPFKRKTTFTIKRYWSTSKAIITT